MTDDVFKFLLSTLLTKQSKEDIIIETKVMQIIDLFEKRIEADRLYDIIVQNPKAFGIEAIIIPETEEKK